MELEMKIFGLSIPYLFIVIVLFSINNDTLSQNQQAKLILNEEYGFITKEEGLAFLLSNALVDTANNLQEWNGINPTDTIGKYYRIENGNNNYMVCLPYSVDFFHPMYFIIEINPYGEIIQHEKFDFGNKNRWDHYYRNFFKFDNFWGIIAMGGPFLESYVDVYLFKDLFPQDSFTRIRSSEFKIMNKNSRLSKKQIIKYYSMNMELDGNELIFRHKLWKGKIKTNKDRQTIFQYGIPRNKFRIRYFYEDGNWKTYDLKKLEKLRKFMKVKPHQILI